MKKFFTIFVVSSAIFGVFSLNAQNIYRNYFSGNVPRPQSVVTLEHSNGYIYHFQIDAITQILSVSEINPLTMSPTGNDWYFIIKLDFYANGVFEDHNGNFVIFGYSNRYYGYESKAVFYVVDSNFSNCEKYELQDDNSFEISNDVFLNGILTSGCSGFDDDSNEIYMFVNSDGSLVSYCPSNSNTQYHKISPSTDKTIYTDISWDASHLRFIASGSVYVSEKGYLDAFFEIFSIKYILEEINENGETTYLDVPILTDVACKIIKNQTYPYTNEGKSLHVQIHDSDLLLYHDLRFNIDNTYVYDVIWVSLITHYYSTNPSISNSWFYILPNSKLSVKDMIFNNNNRTINLLGELNHCSDGISKFFGCFRPYWMSSGIDIAYLGTSFTGETHCINDQPPFDNIYFNNISTFNLSLNSQKSNYPILISGISEKESFLTETIDISTSTCDKKMEVDDMAAHPTIGNFEIEKIQTPKFVDDYTFYPYSDEISEHIICVDEGVIYLQQNDTNNLKKYTVNNNSNATINVSENNKFICNYFSGTISYEIFDITGKCLQKGTTQNQTQNRIIVSGNIFIIKASDETGNISTAKIVNL